MRSGLLRALPAAAAASLGLAALLGPDAAHAQAGEALDTAVRSMEAVFRQAAGTLGVWARQLLLGLLVLDLVWRGGRWALSGQSAAEFAEPVMYSVGIVGLAWGFTTFAPDIVGWTARQATILSNAAVPGAGSALTPSGIMGAGLDRAVRWVEAARLTDPKSWALLACAFIALVMMAAELAMVILVYAEMHLVGLVGVVTLGFAGLSQTRGVAVRYVMTMFAKGFKLMTLLLVADAAHGLAAVAAQANDQAASVPAAGAMAAVLLQMVGVALMVTLPGAVERLVAGAAVGDVAGAGGRMAAGAAVSVGTTAGAAALGAAGGATAGAASAARTAGAGAFAGGMSWDAVGRGARAAVRGAATGALQGGVNWGALGAERGIGRELAARLQERVGRAGASGPEGGS